MKILDTSVAHYNMLQTARERFSSISLFLGGIRTSGIYLGVEGGFSPFTFIGVVGAVYTAEYIANYGAAVVEQYNIREAREQQRKADIELLEHLDF